MTDTLSNKDAVLRLAAGRAKASQLMPYLSTALFAIKPIETPGYKTFGTDKRWRMYWDPAFCMTMSVNECAAVWLHEVGHLLRDHSARFKNLLEPASRHPLFNIAGDAAINADLREAGITLPLKPWFPERIVGADRKMTAEQMYRLLLDSPLINKVKKESKPRLLLMPNTFRYDYTAPQTIAAATTVAMFTGPTTVTITDAEGVEQAGAVGAIALRGTSGLSFTLTSVLPAGAYAVTAECAGAAMAGQLFIVEPTITLRPDHIAVGQNAPVKVTVVGQDTRFTQQSTIEVLDDAGVAVTGITDVLSQSATYMTFMLPVVPHGTYTVRATAGTEVSECALPVGLPYLELLPDALPSGFAAPQNLQITGEDIVFDHTTVIDVLATTLLGPLSVPGAVTNPVVLSATLLTFDLAVPLPDGQYPVQVTSGGRTGVATLTVGSGEDGPQDPDSSPGSGEDESEDTSDESGDGGQGAGTSGTGGPGEGDADSDDEMPDCGSGAGGPRRAHEQPDGEGEDGSVDEGRGSLIREGVARSIKEHAASRGTVPGGWERWAELTLNPKVDWRKELNSTVRRATASIAGLRDYTYARPSRRSSSVANVILPAMRAPRPPVVFLIQDTSGSMGDKDLAQSLSEIGEIIARVSSGGGDPVRVISCDASASQVQVVRDAKKVSLMGGGGTDMRVGIAQAAAARPRADIIITLTDGDTPWPSEPPKENPHAKYIALLVRGDSAYSTPPDWMHKIVIDG